MAGLLGTDEVSYQPASLDPWANQRIDTGAQDSMKSADEYNSARMNQVPEAAQMAQQTPDQYQAHEQALGMGDSTNMALHNRYQAQVGRDLQQKSQMSQYEAQLERAAKMQKQQNFVLARMQIDTQAKERQMQADAANAAARGHVLGSVLGLAGGVVGSIYGGPAGGAAGGKIGQGFGNAMDGGR